MIFIVTLLLQNAPTTTSEAMCAFFQLFLKILRVFINEPILSSFHDSAVVHSRLPLITIKERLSVFP